MNNHCNAIIIGGGIAGMTAALHLAERGLKPLILEADERVGGRLSGKEEIAINAWKFPNEHGVHGIWSSYLNLKSTRGGMKLSISSFQQTTSNGFIAVTTSSGALLSAR